MTEYGILRKGEREGSNSSNGIVKWCNITDHDTFRSRMACVGQRLGLVLIHDENEVNDRVIGVQDFPV